MKKWNLFSIGALSLMFIGVPAAAQDEDEDYLGCEMLGIGVGAAVLAAGTGTGANAWSAGAAAALAFGLNHTVGEYCDHVTEETVRAYENAMNTLGIQIMWHTYHDPFMPWCLSIKEYDCLPYIPPEDTNDPNRQLFVELAWESARGTAELLLGDVTLNSAFITPLGVGNALQTGFEASGIEDGLAPLGIGLIDPLADGFDGLE